MVIAANKDESCLSGRGAALARASRSRGQPWTDDFSNIFQAISGRK